MEYVRIGEGKLYLSESFSIDLSKIFPPDFKFNNDIYWEVAARFQDGDLRLQVVNYHPKDHRSFSNQTVNQPVDKVIFENLDWDELQYFLWSWNNRSKAIIQNSYSGPKKDSQSKTEHRPNSFSTSGRGGQNRSVTDDAKQNGTNFINAEPREPYKTTVTEAFDILYKDATFKEEAVTFKKKFSWYDLPINIQISNPFIRKEFDSIKSYFAKAINNSKRFSVKATFYLSDGVLYDTLATSPEIEKINDELISSIKKKRIVDVVKLEAKKRKALVDIDELFEALDDKSKNIFNQTTDEVINEVTRWEGIRNGKQLQYLSGSKQSKDHKILFSLKPHFGFMFTVKGLNHTHFCWELRDSHATYIWSTSHAFPISRIEEIISQIQEIGRIEYKRRYRSMEVDQDCKFSILIHPINTDGNPFTKWKQRLDETTDE